MNRVINVYSLKELHDLLEEYSDEDRKKLFVYFDIDETLVVPHPENEKKDILIEEEITKELFSYLQKHRIYFSLVTARFYDTVCNSRKRSLPEIEENIETSIFPILEQLGINIDAYKNPDLKDKTHLIKNHNGKCVGVLYKGIIFGDKKGEIIKHYRKEFGFDKSHPIAIFIDDYEPYLKNVVRHVPEAIVLRRHIEN